MDSTVPVPGEDAPEGQQASKQAEKPRTRLRFKERRARSPHSAPHSSRSRSPSRKVEDDNSDSRTSHRRHRSYRHRHHHRSSKRQKQDETAQDSNLDSEAAFRESLFDAMADDEGADYWEGIYGQPIHTYANTRVNEEKGELERMTEDEYVAYVRARMWEKTHEHVIEERLRREEELKKRRESRRRTQHMEQDKAHFDQEMEEGLRRGAERKKAKMWKESFDQYSQAWDVFNSSVSAGTSDLHIPWPVRSGLRRDLSRENIQAFFHEKQRPDSPQDRRTALKLERVRWHPDKMRQRFGASRPMDEATQRAVTAVFQVVDALWTGVKESA